MLKIKGIRTILQNGDHKKNIPISVYLHKSSDRYR
jgi:hypothetical protein